MNRLLFGPVIVLVIAPATWSHAAALPAMRLSPPHRVEGEAPLLRSLTLDTEFISVDNAAVQSYRPGGLPTRTRADAFGQTIAAELRAPVGFTNGKLSLRPFIGAGGGLGTSSVLDGLTAHSSDGLIWTTEAGLYLRTSERIVWRLSYLRVEAPDFDTKRSAFASRVSTNADVVGAELRFALGQ